MCGTVAVPPCFEPLPRGLGSAEERGESSYVAMPDSSVCSAIPCSARQWMVMCRAGMPEDTVDGTRRMGHLTACEVR
jgi:hypothetical protein